MMSRKKGEKKLGRNPFEHKKTSRPRHQPAGSAPKQEAAVEEKRPSSAAGSLVPGLERGNQDSTPTHPAASAWFFVDLWAGVLTEPFFFWAKSMDIVSKSITAGADVWSSKR